MNIRPTIKPLPYYTVAGNIDYSELARSLRMEISSQLSQLIALQRQQLRVTELMYS